MDACAFNNSCFHIKGTVPRKSLEGQTMLIANVGLSLPQVLYRQYTFLVVEKGSQQAQRNKFFKVLILDLAARGFVLHFF